MSSNSKQDQATMSTKIRDTVLAALTGRPVIVQDPGTDGIHRQEMSRGQLPKRVLDHQRTNQNYYRAERIHIELLNHYENVDRFERETKFDFASYQ
jgi:hypothetical protein